MRLPGGFELSIRRTVTPVPSSSPRGDGWIPVVHEPFMGAWQRNLDISNDTALSYAPVFACVDLLSSDCAKLRWRLVEFTDGVWLEADNPAYAVLKSPNRYQVPLQFVQQWMVSKLVHGNTYVLKQRDQRGVVKALYVLDPQRVQPLVASDGSVWYQVSRDDLVGLTETPVPEAIPAREIIHDRMMAPFHPLCGVSPIFAAALPALQGLGIEQASELFFRNGSAPGGVLTAPGKISDETAARLKAYWETNFSGQNVGKVAVLGDSLKYEAMSVNAVDAQLIDQLKWTGEMICAVYHVPAYMAGVGPPPPYANVEPLLQLYYSQGLQRLLVSAEQVMDQGLEFPRQTLGTEFDIDDLIWMNTETRTKAAHEAIASGAMSPDEARRKYFSLPPVPGGDTPYLQQQYFSLKALAARDAADPFATPAPAPAPAPMDAAAIAEAAVAEFSALWEAA